MSVYTPVSQPELDAFLSRYDIGAAIHFNGIEYGITNSNFWLETEQGLFVLTLYEQQEATDLDYMLGLQQYLFEHGVACATPVIDRRQGYFSVLNGRPAAINHRINGEVCHQLEEHHCLLIGEQLGRFHLVGKDFGGHRSNPCGTPWRMRMQQKLMPLMNASDQKLLNDEIDDYALLQTLELPGGATHSDLFHDNCLFDGDQLGGIIDFDYACDESFLYDIAITVNDCCIEASGEFDPLLYEAFFRGYESIRVLQAIEREHFNLMLRVAATRFWLSRLHDLHFPLPGEMTFCKDPEVIKQLLLRRRQKPSAI